MRKTPKVHFHSVHLHRETPNPTLVRLAPRSEPAPGEEEVAQPGPRRVCGVLSSALSAGGCTGCCSLFSQRWLPEPGVSEPLLVRPDHKGRHRGAGAGVPRPESAAPEGLHTGTEAAPVSLLPRRAASVVPDPFPHLDSTLFHVRHPLSWRTKL